MAPSDYFQFTNMKQFLEGNKFVVLAEMKAYIEGLEQFLEGMQKMKNLGVSVLN